MIFAKITLYKISKDGYFCLQIDCLQYRLPTSLLPTVRLPTSLLPTVRSHTKIIAYSLIAY